MTREELQALPASPPGVAEWEDLLVRLEIMPRALRGTLDDLHQGAQVREILRDLLDRETRAGEWLESVAGGGAHPRVESGYGDARWLSDRFAAVRARNFAMVQRRGVEVWGWAAETPDGTHATVYQLLTWLMRSDATILAALRDTARDMRADREVSVC